MSLNNLNTLTNLRTRTESKRDAGTNETTIIKKSKIFHPDLKKFLIELSEIILMIISTRKNTVTI